MRRRRFFFITFFCFAALETGESISRAEEEIAADTQRLFDEVAGRILAVAEPPSGYEWPPEMQIVESTQVNAFASCEERGGKRVPRVSMYTAMLRESIENQPDRMAMILGHEVAHILLNHVLRQSLRGETRLIQHAFSREDEIAADLLGMELALKAGYSFQGAVGIWKRMDELKLEYSSFEGLRSDHPTWKERLAILDKQQPQLWRAMAAFDNGVVFLATERYAAAERCFQQVTKEFPACYEAWSNLGYALLMRYCDALRTDDLREFDVGQIVVGGFYHRPASLEAAIRGIDEEVWFDAVGAFREALRLKPELILARANLGLAYLVRPTGKDVGQASRFLQEALDAVGLASGTDPTTEAAVLINAGVADLAGGKLAECNAKLQRADELEKVASALTYGQSGARTWTPALRYNQALLLAASTKELERRAAVDLMHDYLTTSNRNSAWWPLAFERYTQLCQDLDLAPKSSESFATNATQPFRPIVSLNLPDGGAVDLSQPMENAIASLGECDQLPVVRGTNILHFISSKYDIELITARQVLAIRLRKATCPPVQLLRQGLGAAIENLQVGMTKDSLEKILGSEPYDYQEIDSAEVYYRFYHRVGLAVRIRQDLVQELVIVQIPRQSPS